MQINTLNLFACKVLKKSEAERHSAILLNEINIHQKLKHAHIVEFIESLEDDLFVYIIQYFCSKNSLWDLVQQFGTVTSDQCVQFVSQILEGLEYMHWKGYIHRDIKPSNILIDENNQIKIADFGLTIHYKNAKAGEICGTVHYLSPECVEGEGPSYACDIWAVGVTAFVLLIGYRPFSGDGINDKLKIYHRIMNMDYK